MTKISETKSVLVGVIGAPHGVRGELRVKSHTGDPLALGNYGTLRDAAGRAFDITELRSSKNVLVVRFEQVRDRTAAKALNGVELFVDRSQLPDEELDDDEFFVADLVGLAAHGADGEAIGEVIAVHNFGAGDILEVAPADVRGGFSRKQAFLVEFSRRTVPDIDFDTRRLTLLKPAEIEAHGKEEDSGAQRK
ncbi:ribosome maturation factor RimM [Oricola cellulosilytica]|uniref:Ribosome maturation factor RimM n=1 Tax=Oricola cellulosilytica TaxID=1429082 RepID=A0A4R0PFR1_9HYPH|nr:ribosome maturation factor RimM [Oricola cellulosilytica]TCD15928.1 ribosome maturation factor RimM [Oricola cellulosilytica]